MICIIDNISVLERKLSKRIYLRIKLLRIPLTSSFWKIFFKKSIIDNIFMKIIHYHLPYFLDNVYFFFLLLFFFFKVNIIVSDKVIYHYLSFSYIMHGVLKNQPSFQFLNTMLRNVSTCFIATLTFVTVIPCLFAIMFLLTERIFNTARV